MTSEIKPSVALAGSTGGLGKHIANALLAERFRPQFSKVILLSRQDAASSPILSKWQEQGATIRKYDEENLAEAIADVDVLVNAVGSNGHPFKKKLLQAVPQSKVSVYLPSEFGVDHILHDFSQPEWDKKKEHLKLMNSIIPNIKICRVLPGLFLDDSIGPWFGFDTKNGKYESIGPANTPVSFTSLDDVGKTIAILAAMPKQSIPTEVRIGGDTASMNEVSQIMKDAGAGEITISSLDLKEYKEKTVRGNSPDPSGYLRFLMGEGKINNTSNGLGNQNELVNPGESKWRWRTLRDLAKETGGKPWADFPWPPN